MAPPDRMVIVGGGLAGARAAEALRDNGYDGAVVLVAEEPELPYERPPLSKAVLRDEAPDASAFLHDAGFYASRAIELVPGVAAMRLDVGAQRVELSDGRRLDYRSLLLATGAAPRRLDLPGADLGGVRYLRSLADARQLRTDLAPGRRLAIIGAGWIGCEVAASARARGVDVTVIDPLPLPLQRVLGPDVAVLFRDLHGEHGVDLRLGTGVTRLLGARAVEAVETTDGARVPADAVLVGIGVRPRSELAAAAGLAVGPSGIEVDATLRTSAPSVLAAGDVATAYHPHYGSSVHVEHWAVALNQGPAAARSMLGATEPYLRLPYFYSDQYDLGLEYIGHAPRWDRIVVRGSIAERKLIAFYVVDGAVAAALAVNVWDVIEPLRALITSRRSVPDALLADPDVDIAHLSGAAS